MGLILFENFNPLGCSAGELARIRLVMRMLVRNNLDIRIIHLAHASKV